MSYSSGISSNRTFEQQRVEERTSATQKKIVNKKDHIVIKIVKMGISIFSAIVVGIAKIGAAIVRIAAKGVSILITSIATAILGILVQVAAMAATAKLLTVIAIPVILTMGVTKMAFR